MKLIYFKHALIVLVGTFLLVVASFFLFVSEAYAQQPLVVCGTGSSVGAGQKDATGCQACHIFELIDRLIRFLILIAVPIASLLFAYAGFKYFSSGVAAHSEATGIFRDALFGFIVALCGYLIIDTILQTLVKGEFAGPSWHTVSCVSNAERLKSIIGPGLQFDKLSVQPQTGIFNESSAPTNENPQVAVGNCSPSALAADWGSNAARMSCVVMGESTCRPGIPSNVDIGADGNPFSWGLYQINISDNEVQCPGQAPLQCRTAYVGKNRDSRVKADAASQQLFQECVAAATNVSCATYTAQRILREGGWSRWSADSRDNCGRL